MHVYASPHHEGRDRVTPMAGTVQKSLDHKGTYQKACALLANDYGYKLTEVYGYWREIAMMVEYESKWPRHLAEWRAMHMVRESLCRQGGEGS